MNGVNLRDALAEMKEDKTFSIKFVSYDKKRKTGGIVKYFPEVKLIQKNKTDSTNSKTQGKTKRTNSYVNATRSIKVFVDGVESSTIRKFHIFLLLEINGKKDYL